MIKNFHNQKNEKFIQEGLLSPTSESMCMKYWLAACSRLPTGQEKVWIGELTFPS